MILQLVALAVGLLISTESAGCQQNVVAEIEKFRTSEVVEIGGLLAEEAIDEALSRAKEIQEENDAKKSMMVSNSKHFYSWLQFVFVT